MDDKRKFFSYALIKQGVIDSFKKLTPVHLVRNPVMFLVEIGAAITTYFFFKNIVTGGGELTFTGLVTLWLWFTVLFANFAEAVAEGRYGRRLRPCGKRVWRPMQGSSRKTGRRRWSQRGG